MKSRFYTHNGITQTLGEWCRHFDVPYLKTYMRIQRGMSFLDAITKPDGSLAKPRKPAEKEILITMNEKTQSLHAWTKELDVPYLKVLKRIKRGWDPIMALADTRERVVLPEKVKARAEAKMIGKRYGRLTVQSDAGVEGEKRQWNCLCDCGTMHVAPTNALTSGHTKSCGCLQAETMSRGNVVHGLSGTQVHIAWQNMRARCENQNNEAFKNYGGRGIKVCDRWQTFENFLADMGQPPTSRHSIERINNGSGYDPGNCIWATRSKQSRNKRDNVWVTMQGRKMILKDWCKELGIHPSTVYRRLSRGYSAEAALTAPMEQKRHPK